MIFTHMFLPVPAPEHLIFHAKMAQIRSCVPLSKNKGISYQISEEKPVKIA